MTPFRRVSSGRLLVANGALLLLAGVACGNGGGEGGAAAGDNGGSNVDAPVGINGDAPLEEKGSSAAGTPVVPLGHRYTLASTLTLHEATRRDYSGILPLPTAPGTPMRLWLVDDKPDDVDSTLVEVVVRAEAPGGGAKAPTAGAARWAGPARSVHVENRAAHPLGDDVEDLALLPASGTRPPILVLVGERGPRQRPVSWLALGVVDTAGAGLVTLLEAREASPPGESVGNDGLEGVALLPLGGDTLAVLTFKERTPPIYVRSYLYRWRAPGAGARGDTSAGAPASPSVEGVAAVSVDAGAAAARGTFEPLGEPLLDHVPGVSTQAAATFGPDGDLYVLDRLARRIAVVPRLTVLAALRSPADDALEPREWLDFTEFVPALEGKSGAPASAAPLSIFGTAEGLGFGPDGTLYLLSDNNESGPSVLLILTPRP